MAKSVRLAPLKSKNSLGWLSTDPVDPSYKKKLQVYIQRFVYESEAVGCSRQTGGFIKDLNVNSSLRARNFISYLGLGDLPNL